MPDWFKIFLVNPWVGDGSKGSRGDGDKLTDLFSGSALDAIPTRVMSKGAKNLFTTLAR